MCGKSTMLFSFPFLVWYYFHLLLEICRHLQLKTARSAEMRVKEREREHWMAFYTLLQHLKKRIREYQKDQWQENIGINMETFLLSLPRDIRSDTKRYLCFGAIRGVPFFENLDKQVLNAMCDGLKPVIYKEESYIV